MRKLLFNYSFYSHPEIRKFQGVTNVPSLNRISSRDSKKEEARRRETNKIISRDRYTVILFCCLCVGSSVFIVLGGWGLHQSELDGTKASTRWEGR
jgi:hypothetical protein